MPSSKRIAGLVGPTIVAMIVSEFPLVQPHLYDAQIPPVVYLPGVLMFVAGLAIVRAHNHWVLDSTGLVTLFRLVLLGSGFLKDVRCGRVSTGFRDYRHCLIHGLGRGTADLCGLVMTFKAYSPDRA